MSVLKISFGLLFLTIFCGCAKKIIYSQVKVPIKCDVSMPERPLKSLDSLEYLKQLLVYTEILEQDLKFCTSNEK
ncbi:hypothetical protein [Helicobacter cetorum]|uniref:hypothetical protein n=1 Tax=Helicobacter cetorum TaxID=138563 RepID=UPI000CF173EE|nr:hypothetical protein [Helicobacter cetorum]